MVCVPSLQQFTSHCMHTLMKQLNMPLQSQFGCIYCQTGAESALLNGVFVCAQKCSDAKAAADVITEHFHKLPHCWWVERYVEAPLFRQALLSNGLVFLGDFPGMALEIDTHSKPKIVNDLTIEPVTDKLTFGVFANTLCEAFSMPESVGPLYTSWFEKIGFNGPFYHLMGKVDGQVVSVGTLLYTDAGAYLYNISTKEECRNNGYASSVTYALIELARRLDCPRLALTSSPMAVPLYKKLGFNIACEYEIYAKVTSHT